MTADAGALLKEALALPERDRANMAAELLASLGPPGSDATAAEAESYAREIERRARAFLAGEDPGEDWDDVHRSLLAEFGEA